MSLEQKPTLQDDSPYINQIIDFRNGRYQGSADVYSRRPYGKGMFLTENFMFILSDWINGTASGKTFAIYPDNHLFYGSLYDGRTNKFCAYKQPGKFTIYLKHFINQNNLAIIDDYVSQSLLILYVNHKEWAKLSESERKNHNIFVVAEWGKNKYIEVVNHKVYMNEQQKWKIIEEFSKQTIEKQSRSYSTFISSSFGGDQSSMLFSYQDASQYQLSYEGSSILCKINKNEKIEEDYDVKLIGIYDEEEEIFEMYKKIKSKDKVQEFVKGCCVTTYNRRPKECLKRIREFYKKSTIFFNSCVKVSNFDEIKNFFMSLSGYIDYFLANKYADTFILQNSNSQSHIQAQPPLKKVDGAILKGIQQQVERAVRKKSSPERQKIKKYCSSLYENEEGVYAKIKGFSKYQSSNYLENYIWMVENVHKSKRQTKRLPLDSAQSSKGNKQEKKQSQIPGEKQSGNKTNVQNVALPLRQLKPLIEITSQIEQNFNLPTPTKQSLNQLTSDFYNIQSQIKKQSQLTPKRYSKLTNTSTSRSPFGKPPPSPKASTKRSDRSKLNQKQACFGYSSPLQIKKSNKANWR